MRAQRQAAPERARIPGQRRRFFVARGDRPMYSSDEGWS